MRLVFRVLLLAAVQSIVARALAETPGAAQAREQFSVGHTLFAEGRFGDASDAFKRAYALDPVPKYLYDAAQSARLGGNCAEASVMYQAFVKVAPDADARVAAEENLARCRPAVVTPSSSAAPPSSTAPSSSTAPPPAIVAVTPAPAPATTRRRQMKWIAIGGGSLAGVSLLTAAILDGVAGGKYDQLRHSCAPNCTATQLGALPREIDAATGLFVTAGITAAATGVTLAVLRWSHR